MKLAKRERKGKQPAGRKKAGKSLSKSMRCRLNGISKEANFLGRGIGKKNCVRKRWRKTLTAPYIWSSRTVRTGKGRERRALTKVTELSREEEVEERGMKKKIRSMIG